MLNLNIFQLDRNIQVKQYAEKYSELMKSLTNSNQAFDKFKKEIDRVGILLNFQK